MGTVHISPSRQHNTRFKSTRTADMAEQAEIHFSPDALIPASETGALVEVKFQKNPYQEQKYLEAEPKALGVTQIMLSLFYLGSKWVVWNVKWTTVPNTVSACLSSVSLIAGSVALAAQTLHLPTLKACLGMQVVACAFSVVCFIISSNLMNFSTYSECWYFYHNVTTQESLCERMTYIYEHIIGIEVLVQATQVALSATLAAFCCKVIQCCSPRSNVPVIVVNAPPAAQ
ncbi:uncharacterized protein si:ch211-212k18.8 isoform X1 [Trichomycterus rosablanca]|uniref:uncharacterized protein si:ch211-212k18.8 isoform X1 n=1 Tax=Trichomycterus rosablanca TaxID=2290929 RepID=UPI002F353563